MLRRTLLCSALFSLAAAGWAPAQDSGGRSLFNGRDLTGWEGNPKFWSVREGAITGRTTPENLTPANTFLIWKGGTLKDFELRVQFRIQGGNSGIQYRSKHLGNHVVSGYQADFEAGDRWNGIMYEERGRGILAEVGLQVVRDAGGNSHVVGTVGDPDRIRAAIKKGDWNEYVITARGSRITHALNGVTTVDFTDEETGKRSLEGILALQLHAGPPMTVQFREIRLKELAR